MYRIMNLRTSLGRKAAFRFCIEQENGKEYDGASEQEESEGRFFLHQAQQVVAGSRRNRAWISTTVALSIRAML